MPIQTLRSQRSRSALLLLTGLAAAGVFACAGGAGPAGADATGALLTAKTITVKETFLTAHKSGDPLVINCHVSVEIARPGSVKVDILPPDNSGKKVFYISDGANDHDFNGYAGPDGQYNTLDATADARNHEQFRQLAAVDNILNPDPQKPFSGSDLKPEITNVMLDGKPMILRSESRTTKGRSGAPMVFSNKFWFDATTGFPYRRSDYTTIDGKTDQVTQLDFADWQLDKPIPATEFAFVPPAGSQETPKLLAAGMTAPDFAVTTPDGKTVHLADFKGKTVVLDFWATWCGPCQQSLPHLEKVYQELQGKNVVVLAVCVWDKKTDYDKWIAANAGTKYHFEFAFDPAAQAQDKSIAAALYHATGIPTQYLIDKDGKVAASTTGYGDGDHRLEDNLRQIGIVLPATNPTAVNALEKAPIAAAH